MSWGRLCVCDCVTGEADQSWPLCWNCGLPLFYSPDYLPHKAKGTTGSNHTRGLLLSELLTPQPEGDPIHV